MKIKVSVLKFKNLLLILCLIELCCISISCNKNKDITDTEAPAGCFDLIIDKDDSHNCTRYCFTLDGSCTTDNFDDIDQIEVRWDFDNDGQFDTGYNTSKVIDFYPPSDNLNNIMVSMESRDRSGNSSTVTKLLEFTGLPKAPDLIAGKITISISGNEVDTVRINQVFSLFYCTYCIGNFLEPWFTTYVFLNGEYIFGSNVGCSEGYTGYLGSGRRYQIDIPGEYEFSIYLDVHNVYEETDESNNQSKKTLIVVE